MPEGDSLRKLRDYLAPRLEGHHLSAPDLTLSARTLCPAGKVVVSVDVHGKHLLIHLDPDAHPGGRPPAWVLRIHLGMYGAVHHYRHGETWRGPVDVAQAVLVAPSGVFVAFRCAVCELVEAHTLQDRVLSQLGPDVIARDLNVPELIARARVFGGDSGLIADLLLDQRVAAGIGNVYKSEVLHLCRVWPWTPPDRLSDATLATLYRTARTLMVANVGPGPRVTTGAAPQAGERLWVYGRGGETCRSCLGDTIERARVGHMARVTYFCPTCQAAPSASV